MRLTSAAKTKIKPGKSFEALVITLSSATVERRNTGKGKKRGLFTKKYLYQNQVLIKKMPCL